MKGTFRKVYPVVARSILERTGVSSGCCIDLGGGPGMLGIRMAEITDLFVTVYDINPECIRVANENIAEHALSHRMAAIEGAAEDIRFPDASVDLVISRGSVHFWSDLTKAFSEVHRVLKTGGWAYIGGGMGNAELAAEVDAERAKDPQKREFSFRKRPPREYEGLLAALEIEGTVDVGPGGVWVVFQKNRD
ncbi:MAG TPA: class I SAM-dependent methyltransferase [Telmatospirillum sp.]|nr:class I SAM-dependent methyltransferase [Telmatospirillum sp.]